MPHRVVITGLGPVTPWGTGRQPFWDLFRHGFDPFVAETAVSLEARQSGYRVRDSGPPRVASSLRHVDALARLALVGVELALADASLVIPESGSEDIGVVFGTAYGCLSSNVAYLEGILERGPRFGNPLIFQNTVSNAATGYIAVAQRIRGPNATFASGWTAGLEALDFAFQQIVLGDVRAMVVATADSLCAPVVAHLAKRGLVSPTGVPRPLDRRGDGTVPSEGACGLVLEELGAARRRGATIYAEILGMGHGSDSSEDPSGAVAMAVTLALGEAGLAPAQVQAILSSANGCPDLDRCESRGLQTALGEDARRALTTCPKSLIGETLGCGGILGAAVAALTVTCGWIPATAHYAEPDPDYGLKVLAQPASFTPTDAVLVPCLSDDGRGSAAVLARYQP